MEEENYDIRVALIDEYEDHIFEGIDKESALAKVKEIKKQIDEGNKTISIDIDSGDNGFDFEVILVEKILYVSIEEQ